MYNKGWRDSAPSDQVPLRPGTAPLYLMVENVRKEHNMGVKVVVAAEVSAAAVVVVVVIIVHPFSRRTAKGVIVVAVTE